MITTPTAPTAPSLRRPAYALAALVLLAAAIAAAVTHGTGYWQLGAFILAPDLAFVLAWGGGLERGQLHPRAVPLYNALHRLWGPLALAVLAAASLLPFGYLVAALVWTFHVTIDRAVGYGLRTRDGFQRS